MTSDPPKAQEFVKKHFGISEVLLVVIFVVSGGGVALTDMSPAWGRWFWLFMVPLLAVTSLHEGWVKARDRGDGAWRILRKQVFHWLGLLGAVDAPLLISTAKQLPSLVCVLCPT